MNNHNIKFSQAQCDATLNTSYRNELNKLQNGEVAQEKNLTVFINKKEIVTLMTLGLQSELLLLGWLFNQNFIQTLEQVKSIQVDWEVNAAAVWLHEQIGNLENILEKKTVTSGCGQGTQFGNIMENLNKNHIKPITLKQSTLYNLLQHLNKFNQTYKSAGAVHACALCDQQKSLFFTEDIGRHNAADVITGYAKLNKISTYDKIFYTTGRLTSEMVIKVAQMGISCLISRSGITSMGLKIANEFGIMLIARAKGRRKFNIYSNYEYFIWDQKPEFLTS